MAQTARRKTGFIAETRHPTTDRRVRLTFEKQGQARTRAATDKSRRDILKATVGDTTLSQAGDSLIADLRSQNRFDVADKLESHLRLYLRPVFGEKRLRFLTPHSIGDMARELENRYSHLSPAHFRTGLDFMCRIIRFGYKELSPPILFKSEIPGLRLKRAAYGSRGPQFNHKPIPKGSEVTRRLEESTGGLRILLHLLLLLGLRIGEALGLRRGDVVMDKKGRYWLHVCKSQRRNGTLKEPKTKAGVRRIPLNSDMKNLLLKWLATTQGSDTDQLISGMPGVRLLYHQVVQRHNAFQKRLGHVYGFHRYRATCVTTWLISGVRLYSVMRWIGHADLRMTVQVYASSIITAEAVWWLMNPLGNRRHSPEARMQAAIDAFEGPANSER